MTRQDTIARALETAPPILFRGLEGFSDATRTSQAPNLPNHVAWTLGHLALTIHRVAERVDKQPLPEADFTAEQTTDEAPPQRYDTESICFGSTPTDEPDRYPSFERCKAVFTAAHDRLVAAARGATDEQLDQTMQWGPGEIAYADLFIRMIYHNGVHGGQLIDLRRALGFDSMFK